MVEILTFINETLTDAGVPYEYGEWNSAVSYPYFVGEFSETGYRYEDGCTEGVLTIDGWTRNAASELAAMVDVIRETFADLQAVVDDRLFYVRYGGAISVPSGEADLKKVTVTLYTSEWKGD